MICFLSFYFEWFKLTFTFFQYCLAYVLAKLADRERYDKCNSLSSFSQENSFRGNQQLHYHKPFFKFIKNICEQLTKQKKVRITDGRISMNLKKKNKQQNYTKKPPCTEWLTRLTFSRWLPYRHFWLQT